MLRDLARICGTAFQWRRIICVDKEGLGTHSNNYPNANTEKNYNSSLFVLYLLNIAIYENFRFARTMQASKKLKFKWTCDALISNEATIKLFRSKSKERREEPSRREEYVRRGGLYRAKIASSLRTASFSLPSVRETSFPQFNTETVTVSTRFFVTFPIFIFVRPLSDRSWGIFLINIQLIHSQKSKRYLWLQQNRTIAFFCFKIVF